MKISLIDILKVIFLKKEIAMAIDNTYIPVSLGNTRLRTETAAIVACS
jgi:16S rRNA (uracil1498-N3)-methyltransferase